MIYGILLWMAFIARQCYVAGKFAVVFDVDSTILDYVSDSRHAQCHKMFPSIITVLSTFPKLAGMSFLTMGKSTRHKFEACGWVEPHDTIMPDPNAIMKRLTTMAASAPVSTPVSTPVSAPVSAPVSTRLSARVSTPVSARVLSRPKPISREIMKKIDKIPIFDRLDILLKLQMRKDLSLLRNIMFQEDDSVTMILLDDNGDYFGQQNRCQLENVNVVVLKVDSFPPPRTKKLKITRDIVSFYNDFLDLMEQSDDVDVTDFFKRRGWNTGQKCRDAKGFSLKQRHTHGLRKFANLSRASTTNKMHVVMVVDVRRPGDYQKHRKVLKKMGSWTATTIAVVPKHTAVIRPGESFAVVENDVMFWSYDSSIMMRLDSRLPQKRTILIMVHSFDSNTCIGDPNLPYIGHHETPPDYAVLRCPKDFSAGWMHSNEFHFAQPYPRPAGYFANLNKYLKRQFTAIARTGATPATLAQLLRQKFDNDYQSHTTEFQFDCSPFIERFTNAKLLDHATATLTYYTVPKVRHEDPSHRRLAELQEKTLQKLQNEQTGRK
uniref:FCP1 homology domain-containing protein n=1 Tax=Lankesteria abbotti TaxID=340204 RepID=A0A6T5U6A1_9APIC|mmetsp:Transcript_1401/g.1595  ORF Transcript_1401/g.1595 Transcript_1401/m.1595 type:complete len:548 (+) Transcript_1401:156-1799(+)